MNDEFRRIQEMSNRAQLADIASNYGNRFVRALGSRLSMCVEPSCILVQGDSTGDATSEWFYKSMEWLATQYPKYTFLHRLWNHANQGYDTHTLIQTGSSGSAYAALNGTTGCLTTPDSVPLQITGDLDVRVKVSLDDWNPLNGSLFPVFAAKFGGAANRGWSFQMNGANGKPYLWWSADGTNLIGGAGTYAEASAAPTIADGEMLWLRCTLDVDNGASGHDVKFYTSPDGVTWTQLGTTGTGVGTTSIYACTDELCIGARSTHTSGFWAGKLYYAEVRNGINGAIVASPNLALSFPTGTTSIKDAEGNTWTIRTGATVGNGSPCVILLNASCSGQALAYSADATRFGKQTPMEPQLAFISYSHNEATTTNYQSAYEALCSLLIGKYPNIGVVCVTQNPEKNSESNAFEYPVQHAQRNRQISTLAAKNNYALIDVYKAFMETDNWENLVNDDGVHPTAIGQTLWVDVVKQFLRSATKA